MPVSTVLVNDIVGVTVVDRTRRMTVETSISIFLLIPMIWE
jgi:hypothetical protein